MDAVVDIVTLENLEEKMPRWDPSNSNHLYALVDMGSNGIRFSISDLSPPRARLLNCVYRERAAISLFDALNTTSEGQDVPPLTFPAETISLVSQTLARFWTIAVDDYGVPPRQVVVFATEAMRRAQNAAQMLEAIRAATPDLVVHILAPAVETLFGSVGARSGLVDVKGLFLDLGGGSVQMTYMDSYAAKSGARESGGVGYETAAALSGESMPFGAARLIRILENSEAQARTTEVSKLQAGMKEAFAKLRNKFPSLAATVAETQDSGLDKEAKKTTGIDIYLCGGGFRGYGSILMHSGRIQPYPIPAIGSFTVSGKAFGKTKDMMEINKSFDGKIFGMSKRRRAQFPAIVTVVEALIEALPRIRSVTFCAGGNREGVLMMKLPYEIRESSPLACLGSLVTPPALSLLGQRLELSRLVDILSSAMPGNLAATDSSTVFSLQLSHLYCGQIWSRMGVDADANASAVLHSAVTEEPSCPGLTHRARAVLGLTLCARWGANLGPIDQQLYSGLRALVDAADREGCFWADYIGATTRVLATLITAWPRDEQSITNNIRFHCVAERAKKLKVYLEISLSKKSIQGLDPQDLIDMFKGANKQYDDKKVIVSTKLLS